MVNPDHIVKMASAFYESCVLFSASDLGVFGKLAELGEANAETLADSLRVPLKINDFYYQPIPN